MADCKTCGYWGMTGSDHTCDQILYTGKKRPCPAGDPDCPCWIGKKDFVKQLGSLGRASNNAPHIAILSERAEKPPEQKPRGKLDKGKALELYQQGMTDTEIANRLDASYKTVAGWRERSGMPPNQGNDRERRRPLGTAARKMAWEEKRPCRQS